MGIARRIFGEAPPKVWWRTIATRQKQIAWLGSDCDPGWATVGFVGLVVLAGLVGGVIALVSYHIM